MKRSEIIEHKVLTIPTLLKKIAVWRLMNRKIVFTNGCFDILHKGHTHVLNSASDLHYNVAIIVGLNADASVKRLKGANRPINNEVDRANLLASMHVVDAVCIFEEDTPFELIKAIQPDYLVKGGDYNADTIVGADLVKANNGQVVIIPFLNNYSTTSILERK